MPETAGEDAFGEYRVEQTPLGRVVIAPALPPGVALFYTTRDIDGFLDDVRARAITDFLRHRFGIEAPLITCNQVHGATAQKISNEWRATELWRECDSCDALWTHQGGVALGIKVADCLPVTIAGDGILANIHSGWRGTVQKITAATLNALPLDPSSARAWLGPSIRACCFEVGDEVVEAFRNSYGDIDRFVDRSGIKPHIDVAAVTTALLREHGFPPHNIFDSRLCTRCDGSLFHSYRRDRSGGGRNLAIAAQ